MRNMEKTPSYDYKIPVQYLLENETVVALCPILDVSAYGNSIPEAETNFRVALDIFFEETIKHGTIDEVLKEHGWKKVIIDNKPRWNPPEILKSDYQEIKIPA